MNKITEDRGILDILKKRATCRNFLADEIPEDIMSQLLEAVVSAPSSGGFQRVSIIVVREPSRKKRLVTLSRGQKFIEKAPVSFIFCIDHRRTNRIAEYEGAPTEPGLPITSLWMGIVDATIAAQSLALAAEAFGLRSCYNGNVLSWPDEMSELLNLPAGVVPAIMLTAGYPASTRSRLSKKYPASVLIHEETYRDLPIEKLYAIHKEKFPETYRLTPERREKLHRILIAQCGEDTARQYLEKIDEERQLTPCQYWFGCYYNDEGRDFTQQEEYLSYLAKHHFSLTEKA
jgi:nitroreductase